MCRDILVQDNIFLVNTVHEMLFLGQKDNKNETV